MQQQRGTFFFTDVYGFLLQACKTNMQALHDVLPVSLARPTIVLTEVLY
jgi:hypothetical protein